MNIDPILTPIHDNFAREIKASDKSVMGIVTIYLKDGGSVEQGHVLKLGIDLVGESQLTHEVYAKAVAAAAKVILEGKTTEFRPLVTHQS